MVTFPLGFSIPSLQNLSKKRLLESKCVLASELFQELSGNEFQHRIRSAAEHKLMVMQRSGQLSDETKKFCSWDCVKVFAMHNVPLQLKYQTAVLIDLAAGYMVTP